MERLQLGGERGYGWGDTKTVKICESKDSNLFGKELRFQEQEGQPSVRLLASKKLLAHAVADNLAAAGEVEPLVGREWRSHLKHNHYAGQHIEFNQICFAPGSDILAGSADFLIGNFGVWKQRV